MLTLVEILIGIVVIVGVARYIIKGYSAAGVLVVGGIVLLSAAVPPQLSALFRQRYRDKKENVTHEMLDVNEITTTAPAWFSAYCWRRFWNFAVALTPEMCSMNWKRHIAAWLTLLPEWTSCGLSPASLLRD